jgi:hypothetical protein
MEAITRLPGGTAIVFALMVMIAATAFLRRSGQGFRPRPQPARG